MSISMNEMDKKENIINKDYDMKDNNIKHNILNIDIDSSFNSTLNQAYSTHINNDILDKIGQCEFSKKSKDDVNEVHKFYKTIDNNLNKNLDNNTSHNVELMIQRVYGNGERNENLNKGMFIMDEDAYINQEEDSVIKDCNRTKIELEQKMLNEKEMCKNTFEECYNVYLTCSVAICDDHISENVNGSKQNIHKFYEVYLEKHGYLSHDKQKNINKVR
ncbi:hypothetical protein BDAP_002312 [Binucleata daphniae]